MEALHQLKQREMGKGFQQLKDNVEKIGKEVVKFYTKLKHCKTSIEQHHTEESIKSKRRKIDQTRKKNSRLEKELKCKIDELENLQLEVDQLTTNIKPDEERKLHDRIRELQDMIARAEREVDEISSGLSSRLDFKFRDTYRNFDRNCVKGVLINLLDTKHECYYLALEIAAGGMLYEIVVDNEKTAKDILMFGSLTNCVTIIPLNRISLKTVDRRKIDKARQYAFGSSNICETGELAKNVTFHRDIKVKPVTLDGDQFVVMRWRVLLRTIRLFQNVYETAI
ncbi:hypothetical protein PsorP6_005021 [Peronosclerospora sorghi]|uniref:Uncharacterized protein n=1 Tax=Peronosclerospora sorghi TaxID=230839 RepID=A0ACC0W1C9_9STRA|nr:hypothetical protein PsorP6_005021 [Peronosclerospora sorghi]